VVFDFKGNCSEIYPLECDSAYFEILKDEEPDKQQTISFYYTDRKYTVISQTIKTSGADMVSKIGGVLGLFLDFTFLLVYRSLINVFNNVFVLFYK
jgi:hypothetical protein